MNNMMTEKTFSSGELMNFLERFQKTMEVRLEDTKASIDTMNKKIDIRLNDLDDKVKVVMDKIDNNETKAEEVEKRMDRRLTNLEEEMKKSLLIRRRSEELRVLEKNMALQPAGSSEDKDRRDNKTHTRTEDKKTPEKSFRSTWAREIQQELEKAALEAQKISDEKTTRVDGRKKIWSDVEVRSEMQEREVREERRIPENWEEEETRKEPVKER